MKLLKNENGSAIFYLLWIITTVIVISMIIVNISRVYAVKQQASSAAELSAVAATGDILTATEEAIKEYDAEMFSRLEEGQIYIPLWETITDRINWHRSNGQSKQEAYIKAFNEMLPGSLNDSLLKGFFTNKFKVDPTLGNKMYQTVRQIVKQNEGNEEHLEIKISTATYRVEVKTDATFESITDGKILARFLRDIPQEGYGPRLDYLKNVLN